MNSDNTIRLFNIQRYSVHDGDGIRTNIFVKGCPLKCEWCSNPESQSFGLKNSYNQGSCMECMGCTSLCPENALTAPAERNEHLCSSCFKCEKICPTASRKVLGKDWRIDDVVDEVLKDHSFFKSSGGGVTISGGEPLSQPIQTERLARELKNVGLHLAIETCGYASWDKAAPVLDQCDQILYDIKEMDTVRHKQFTGVDNTLILENARRAALLESEFIVRIPVIGGYNNSKDSIHATAQFSADIGADKVNLLPYHRFGENKYKKNNMHYKCTGYTPSDSEMTELVKIVEHYGLEAKIGG